MKTVIPVPVLVGRPNRKLLARLDQLKGWRNQGLSVADIHRAFIAEGVEVGYSTVFREVGKYERQKTAHNKVEEKIPATQLAETKTSSDAPQKSKADRFFDTERVNPILERLKKEKE